MLLEMLRFEERLETGLPPASHCHSLGLWQALLVLHDILDDSKDQG